VKGEPEGRLAAMEANEWVRIGNPAVECPGPGRSASVIQVVPS
jgi:hypothetical protein